VDEFVEFLILFLIIVVVSKLESKVPLYYFVSLLLHVFGVSVEKQGWSYSQGKQSMANPFTI
jgi:hypothetical protein